MYVIQIVCWYILQKSRPVIEKLNLKTDEAAFLSFFSFY